jgi:hypothetical protein
MAPVLLVSTGALYFNRFRSPAVPAAIAHGGLF